jgi:hypothetical protein
LKKVVRFNDRDLFKNERAKKFLVCFDNAEDLIDAKKEEFRSLIKKLLNNCHHLQIIITSQKHLNKIDDSIENDLLFIPELKGSKPVELFLAKAERYRPIPIEEIVSLIQFDGTFDVAEFTRNILTEKESDFAVQKMS